ncbi:MAG: GAF domain-containing protein [Myxococcales bacterium]|nr:GAF domain-containing protein [Myxococcota bacterium]MDW8283562.1 GAF domain-containing protein [Myxococcales bacterium]
MYELERRVGKLTSLLEVARALTAERDLDRLLEIVIAEAARIVDAERCTLYLVDRNAGQLWSKIAQGPGGEVRVPLGVGVAGYVARVGQLVNLSNPSSDPRFDRNMDRGGGPEPRSLLCVPMKSPRGEVIGVIVAVNKRAGAFDAQDEELLEVLAGQVAVATENAHLYGEIERLFDGFVRAAVVAIESRDPSTAGHSQRVADLTLALMDAVEQGARGPWAGRVFTADERISLRYAALLHDFGKVGVREQVLTKANKLFPWEMEVLELRFQYAKKSLEAESLKRRIHLLRTGAGQSAIEREESACQAQLQELDAMFDFVRSCNRPAVLSGGGFERLREVRRRFYRGPDGKEQPLLSDAEVERLSIQRGSLSPDELREIQSHVSHTVRFLNQIPWTSQLRRVPDIAAGHHERLDGSGYPLGLLAPQIGIEARMMAIADVYDALTAADRPYKKAVPHDSALRILQTEVDGGRMDAELFRLFVEAEVPIRVLGREVLLQGRNSWPLK